MDGRIWGLELCLVKREGPGGRCFRVVLHSLRRLSSPCTGVMHKGFDCRDLL